MTEFILRGQTYTITNASDLLVEEFMQVMNDMQSGKTTGRESRMAIAELMNSACPDLPKTLVHYQCREYPDGSRDRSGSLMTLDIDEVTAFSKALVLQIMERRLSRLKETDGGARQSEIDVLIKELETSIPTFREESKNLQLDTMLRSVSVSKSAKTTEASKPEVRTSGNGFKPQLATKPTLPAVDSKAAQIAVIEAELAKLRGEANG
jgi:hypothetical protein